MFGLNKKILIGLLNGLVNESNHTKCVWLSKQKCMIQPTLINLHPNEYGQEFHYSPFAVKLDRCVGGCNTFNDLSNKPCAPNKTEDLNLSVFKMITGINKSKTLTKHISCEYKCKFDGRQFHSDQWWNSDQCRCDCKKCHLCKQNYVWNPAICICENEKYLASIMDDSAGIYDEVIESYDEGVEAKSYDKTKTISTNFNDLKTTCKT